MYGVIGISQFFCWSTATANSIKKSGEIKDVVTQIGREIIIDAEFALELAGRKFVKVIIGKSCAISKEYYQRLETYLSENFFFCLNMITSTIECKDISMLFGRTSTRSMFYRKLKT